ncbi:hypothetical protein BDN70DRAFT_872923 [Pholiota conissans]|uniref:Protein kinase domain-containing protein n=1 Tax=Pholiota conissans TaxID=109636 RepID=A0A9P6CYL8_9AGAR|nr:hypothetical protein BDN70DRAFT_872923 [Pholiota conissans]
MPFTAAEWERQQGRDDYFFLDRNTDIREALVWWNNLSPWFQSQGYTVYEKEYIDRKVDWYRYKPTATFSGETCFPYAYIGGEPDGRCYDQLGCGLGVARRHPRLIFAQDSESRHVCIKLLRPNSDEFKIINFLHQQTKSWNEKNFPCVAPVLNILSNESFHFAVFPRWDGGSCEVLPWFNTMGEVLNFIESILKGLSYLHDNRIFHRDIHEGNFLTSHFGCPYESHSISNQLRQQLRSSGQMMYALTDFDLSLMLPAETDLRSCWLPIAESYPGTDDKPYGVLHGELSFNPFAYDVGCLGIALSSMFQHLCPSLPLLGPLLSGMLTSNIDERLTAREALEFLTENRRAMPEYETLQPSEAGYATNWECCDHWLSLSPMLTAKWARYKFEHPSYFMQQVVAPLCQRVWGLKLVQFVRRFVSFKLVLLK